MKITELLQKRNTLSSELRKFFSHKKFLEVQTPSLVMNPGLEPNLEYFSTEFIPSMNPNSQKKSFYLPTSPEYSIKKILSKLEKPARVFELAKSFRNGEISKTHQPEFMMLEFYQTPCELEELSNLTFNLLAFLATSVSASKNWQQRQDFDLEDLFIKHASTDFDQIRQSSDNFSDSFHLTFLNKVEPELAKIPGQIYLWNYPIEEAMLSKSLFSNPLKAHRFEVFYDGAEIGNAFDELLKREALSLRCKQHQAERIKIYGSSPDLDEDFLSSCEDSSNESMAGIALGWDRIVMKLLNLPSLAHALALPHTLSPRS